MPYDRNTTRHITMPNIPYVRYRLEALAGDLAEEHDEAYLQGNYYRSDMRFVLKATGRAFKTASDTILLIFLAVFSGPAFIINHIFRQRK